MVTARTAKERNKIQYKITYDNFKHYETEQAAGNPITIISLNKREMTLSQPIGVNFTLYDLSKLYLYKTYYDKLQSYFEENNLKSHRMDTDSLVIRFGQMIQLQIDRNYRKIMICLV